MIKKAQATITLSGLNPTYDGSAKSASATTDPANLSGVSIEYSRNGEPVANPTNAGTYDVVAKLDNANYYQAQNAIGTLNIAKATPTINWTIANGITYGEDLTGKLDAKGGSVAGSFKYSKLQASGDEVSVSDATKLNAGTHTLKAVFTPNDTANYNGASKTVDISVAKASLNVKANNASKYFGAANPSFSDEITGIRNGDNITASYSTTATATSAVGTYPIKPQLNDPEGKLVNYNVVSNDGTLTITYSWSNVLQPINLNGSSIFKLGSTVPVKFKLTNQSAGYANATAKLYTAKVSSGIAGQELEATSTAAADSGNTFRYDATNDQYIFNLGTKSLSEGTFRLRIDLGDGTTNTVDISLKK